MFDLILLYSGYTVAALIAYYVYLVCRQKYLYRHIPGSDRNDLIGFFIGNIGKLLKYGSQATYFREAFFNEMERCKSKTVKVRVFHQTMIATCDPDLVKRVMIDDDCPKDPFIYKAVGYPGGERYMGNGLVPVIDKEKWRIDRAFFNPGFHKQCLKDFLREFNEKGDILIDNLRNLASLDSKKSIRLMDKFNQFGLDVIASIAFGMDLDSINNPQNRFCETVHEIFVATALYIANPFLKILPWKREFVRKTNDSIRYIRNVGREQIKSRIEALKNGEELRDDILTRILKHNKDEEINVEDMIDQFVTFFVAGQETTASALSSMFLVLGLNPDVVQKLKDEIDTVIGKKALIDYDDLAKLKYTEAAFKETLRLYSPAELLNRKNVQEININGLVIPKDSNIFISTHCCGRDKDAFEDPLKFNPDRFMDEEKQSNITYSYFPFSLGPRNCIGQNFAKFEAKVMIAKFIQNFDFELDPNQSFEIIENGLVKPKDGTKCFISIRK